MAADARVWASSSEHKDDVLVIGIDFGTTNSGVAWATSADFRRRNINYVSKWPGTGREEGKVPTELCYDRDQIYWGYDIPEEATRLRWFKLLLLEPEDLSQEICSSSFLQLARTLMRCYGKTPVDIVTDYLRLLWNHAVEKIKQELGKSAFLAFQLHIVLTVPAIWKDYARQSMETAAEQAGLLRSRLAGPTYLSLVPEPEAASLSTLLERCESVKKGDVYVVCDSGGGTVDLITYEIESINPIRMREAVEGDGGLCGGVFIDEQFEQICRERLGPAWLALSEGGKHEVMQGEWEQSIKPQFTTRDPDKEYTLKLPTEMFLNEPRQRPDDTSREPFIRRGRIRFKEAHIKQTFTKVLAEIEGLVNAQVRLATRKGLSVTGVILVGGLGGSPYLYDFLEAELSTKDISVLQASGMRPRIAICQGAVCKGFVDGIDGISQTQAGQPIEITSKICRASYGISYRCNFEEGKHLEEDKVWSDVYCGWRAKRQMEWYLKKGDCVSKSKQTRHEYSQRLDFDWDGHFTDVVYQCEDDVPPSRRISSVTKLCHIEWSLNEAAISSLETVISPDNKKLKRICYEIAIFPSGRGIQVEVYHRRKRLGRTEAHVTFASGSI